MDMFYADVRWLEPGWRETFRLRLSGWLPKDWVSEGIRNGVISWRQDESRIVDISARGRRLTDLSDYSLSDDTTKQLGLVLAAQDWDSAWFASTPGIAGGWLGISDMFPEHFREKVVGAFALIRSGSDEVCRSGK